jgi:hypothetical protein
MALQFPPSSPDNCCLPGDITVTKVPTGYLVGRALERGVGVGPWWQYVATLASFGDAAAVAHALAKQAGTRAWLHKSGDDYDPLTDHDRRKTSR